MFEINWNESTVLGNCFVGTNIYISFADISHKGVLFREKNPSVSFADISPKGELILGYLL
jgi:hypothetical protein